MNKNSIFKWLDQYNSSYRNLLKYSLFCVLNRPIIFYIISCYIRRSKFDDRRSQYKDVVSVHNLYKQYFYFEQQNNDKILRKRIWSACIGRATTHKSLISAIPLLPPVDTLSCWVSPLARFASPQTTWPPQAPLWCPYRQVSLVRTPIQREPMCSRSPVLIASSNSSLPVAWITGSATKPS